METYITMNAKVTMPWDAIDIKQHEFLVLFSHLRQKVMNRIPANEWHSTWEPCNEQGPANDDVARRCLYDLRRIHLSNHIW